MKKIKSSFFSRAPKLISSAINLGRLKEIDKVVNNLSELKGMPQKIGQLISMDFSEYIPEELRDKFAKLQSNSEAVAFEKIIEVLEKNLDKNLFNQIENINPIPLGAGSIGQVHQAEYKNKKVAFKIKYPGIEKTINSDLTLILPFVSAFEIIRPKTKDFSILIKEAKNMLVQEMDYKLEANNLKRFKSSLAHDTRYYIPEVIQDLSNDKIICMEFVEGQNLKEFIQTEKDSDRKRIIAQALLELFIIEFFSLGLVQTDPNFANYLVKENNQIVLLDFGATKEFSKDFQTLYFNLLNSAYQKDLKNILIYGEKLGLVDRKDNFEAIKLFENFLIDVLSFFRKENNPMDFSNENITSRLLENGWKLFQAQKISRPDSNLVFLHRKLGGLFSVLKESKIQMDLYPFWLLIVEANTKKG
jgi:predicted unusual protein kinase regulating ubiquinone biosynthesis (AarF/ABC1/UbiB family)